MVADVVGYSRLMETDEAGTLAALRERRRQIFEPVVRAHGGRIVKFMGDGALIEFNSAVSAVTGALEVQEKFARANEGLPENQRILLRIGINAGDVIGEGADIYGEGVNVAARLETLAEPGGICVSRNVHDQIRRKLGVNFNDMGLQVLKNITEPVHAYRVGPPSAPGVERPPLTLPSKPSIAVLPFANMSNIPGQEFFADGMTEDIITALSRISELFVISRNSSFVYKGRPVRIEDVARELGVRHILEGSVRVAGNRVRVTAQLIDGQTGGHVWAENFDGNLDDIFAVQDDITRNIALAMQVKLTYGESARLWEGQTKSLRAWEKMSLGRGLFLRFNSIDNREARRLFEQSLEIDPSYAGALVLLAHTFWWEARFDKSADKEACLQIAEQYVQKALGIDPNLSFAYMMSGGIAFLRDQHDEAIRLCQKAVDLSPSDAWVWGFLGMICVFGGESERAVAALKTAMRLSPHHPSWYGYQFTLANLWAGDLPAAESAALSYRQREPDDPYAYTNLATVYAFQQREQDAATLISELKQRFPAFRTGNIILSKRYKAQEKLNQVVDLLRRAGLPD